MESSDQTVIGTSREHKADLTTKLEMSMDDGASVPTSEHGGTRLNECVDEEGHIISAQASVEASLGVVKEMDIRAVETEESVGIVKQNETLTESEQHCVDALTYSVISEDNHDRESLNSCQNKASTIFEDMKDAFQDLGSMFIQDGNKTDKNESVESKDISINEQSQSDRSTNEMPKIHHPGSQSDNHATDDSLGLLPSTFAFDNTYNKKITRDIVWSSTVGMTDKECETGHFESEIDGTQDNSQKIPVEDSEIGIGVSQSCIGEKSREHFKVATHEAFHDGECGISKEPDVDDVNSCHDVVSKSPLDDATSCHDMVSKSEVTEEGKQTSKASTSEKRTKISSKGFSLGNIVSRLLKYQVESKQEEVDVNELKEIGESVPEKTQSKRSEQKQQGKQMRAAAHAAMMMYTDGDYNEAEETATKEDAPQLQESQSKDMTDYASNTMDELLGLYGYDQLEKNECDGLQLSTSLSQSKTPITGSVTGLKPNQKQNQTYKPHQEDTGLVISNVTSMAPSQNIEDDTFQETSDKKTNFCAECSVAVDIMLVASNQSFCSQVCLDNHQGRQTLVCDYCCGMITQAATQKFVRETQEGQKQFCSQLCSEEFSKRVRHCNTCGKEISKASDGILAPVGSGGKFVDFCKQECVDNYGNKPSIVQEVGGKQEGGQPRYWAQDTFFICAICSNYAKAKHVISLQGKLNGLCSTDCFTRFKEKNQLAFSLCSQCSALCSNPKMMRSIEIEGKIHRFCSMRCFKMKLKRSMSTITCAACKEPNWAQSMIEEWNGTELVRFFCSTACLSKRDTIPFTSSQTAVPTSKPLIQQPAVKTQPPLLKMQKAQQTQQTSQGSTARPLLASGNKCDHCSKQQRPQFHLTMSDNSIRNFCTYGCVIAFQAQFNVPPVTLPQETLQLTCSQCLQGFSNRPLPLEFKGVVNVFCAQNCLDEFKRVNSVVVECDYCHLEKILQECIYFSGQAHSFCSDGCKLLYKQQFAQRLGLRCTVCDYCAQTCRSRVERMYGNHKKKFCSMACKSQYDKWLSKGAKCDGCRCTGRKLEESFIWRGEMKRVCNQHCLLLFYTQQNIPNMNTQTQSTIPAIQPAQVAPKITTPVITNVVSLAPGQQQSNVSPKNMPYSIKKCHKQTQITTAPPKVLRPPPPPAPLPPAPKTVKNKMTLVKPFTQTKSVSCRPLTSTKETMTDEQNPLIIPVPVPMFVPVPVHMYTTPVPHPVSLPVPVPIPVFIPVACNNVDRLLSTIKEISERIPSDPLEAEMLMLADAIAGNKRSKSAQESKLGSMEGDGQQALGASIELGSLSLQDTEEPVSCQFLADNILKMAADIDDVLEEDPCSDLQDDLNALQGVEEAKVDLPTRSTRSKSSKTTVRRGRSRGSKRTCIEETQGAGPLPEVKHSKEEARNTIGVNGYRYFTSKKKQTVTGKELKSLTWNPNLLEVSSEELSYVLCLICKEGVQPDGKKYSADILHLIFLSIQHQLSDNGRPDNIFTDQFYRRFTDLLHDEIKEWLIDQHPVTNVILNTSINEETLWNAKQLGAHSPYILLSTMIYFNTKHFQLKSLASHKALAFCRIQKQIRKVGSTRSMFLRYYPADRKKVIEAAGKRKREREPEVVCTRLEQPENTENPLRCPVRLYEFYLSKCPDSVRSHNELFYLVPERSCVPDSPVWYSSAPLADHDMNKILTRMLMVMDIHESWAEMSDDGGY